MGTKAGLASKSRPRSLDLLGQVVESRAKTLGLGVV